MSHAQVATFIIELAKLAVTLLGAADPVKEITTVRRSVEARSRAESAWAAALAKRIPKL